jgi:hypothetical protein
MRENRMSGSTREKADIMCGLGRILLFVSLETSSLYLLFYSTGEKTIISIMPALKFTSLAILSQNVTCV